MAETKLGQLLEQEVSRRRRKRQRSPEDPEEMEMERKRWKELIFGAISVLKLAKKIQYRNQHAVVIQKWVRMFLAVRRHRPRLES